ncbi:MAG: glutamyl-tRNA reductase [Elusimicrobia bacterium]|nr:glutamyl-tRNA reductase [Elusimicrobiota bacterium]
MISLVGLNHHTSPLTVRERLASLSLEHWIEKIPRPCGEDFGAVLLSTCNRYELYWTGGLSQELPISEWQREVGLDLAPFLYRLRGSSVARHLFLVASGLDSLVIGESEILGQVRRAYEHSRACGLANKPIHMLFQKALYVGRAVRSATGIGWGQTSVASVAVQLAERVFGDLKKSRILILGAGKIAELSARHLASQGTREVWIANRTWEKAEDLARRLHARPVAWEEVFLKMSEADLVFCSTASGEPILRRSQAEDLMKKREGRSLFLIDLSVPRNVEESVHSLDGVYLYNLEDLRGIVQMNVSKRLGEMDRARRLVFEKAEEFHRWHEALLLGGEYSFKYDRKIA